VTDPIAPPAAVPSSPGPLDGRYRLVEELGRGGMAVVHLAVDERLDREVAVKLLHPHLIGDEVMLDRFHREATAAASVEHPAVVRVHDWGVDDDRPYLVMERVRGRTLRQVLDARGTLQPGEALAILGPAAAGLAAVHARGFVHRDVTPGNLLVDEHGATKVGDFGLARSVAASRHTRNEVVGSPHYLSPEAVRGEHLDPRADVYALGCVLLECLTGEPPYTADSPVAVAARHTTERVPVPSERGINLGPAIDRVVRTATAPDPADRYADAQAFALALAAAVPEGPSPIDLRSEAAGGLVVPAAHATARLAELGVTTVVDLTTDEAPPRGRRLLGRLLRVLLVLAVLAGAGWVGFDRLLAPVVPVPAVVGLPAADARATLVDAGFRVGVEPEERTDPLVPAGDVVAQSVQDTARQRVTTVDLVLSIGPASASLPALEGLTPDQVEARLTALDLDLDVQRRQEFDDAAPEGSVLVVTNGEGVALGEGTTVTERSTVTIAVSRGPAPVDVPALAGRAQADALAELAELGLEASVGSTRFDDDAPQGTVVALEPSAGTTLRRGDSVALVVSDGPEPVEVPDVTGVAENRAVAQLEARGLVADVRDVPTLNPFRSGRVDTQDPAPGETSRRGDRVLLFVWR
jgi:serine/threonine-protein kinase